jgi:hypothetical protein
VGVRAPKTCGPGILIEGVARRIDAVARELTVDAGGALVAIDVPPDCPITLRGERIKFRMLLPRDRVRVTCAGSPGPPVAAAIEVQPV